MLHLSTSPVLWDIGWKAGHTLIDDIGESTWDTCAEQGFLNTVGGRDTIRGGMMQRGGDGVESSEAPAFDGRSEFALLERGEGEREARAPEAVAGRRKACSLSVYKVNLLNTKGDHGEG